LLQRLTMQRALAGGYPRSSNLLDGDKIRDKIIHRGVSRESRLPLGARVSIVPFDCRCE